MSADPPQALRPLLHAFAEALAAWDAVERDRPTGDGFDGPTDHEWNSYAAAAEATEWEARKIGEWVVTAARPWLYRYAVEHGFPPDWYMRFVDTLSLKGMTPADALTGFAVLCCRLTPARTPAPAAAGAGAGPTAGRRKPLGEAEAAFMAAYLSATPRPEGGTFYALAERHGIPPDLARRLRDRRRKTEERAADGQKR